MTEALLAAAAEGGGRGHAMTPPARFRPEKTSRFWGDASTGSYHRARSFAIGRLHHQRHHGSCARRLLPRQLGEFGVWCLRRTCHLGEADRDPPIPDAVGLWPGAWGTVPGLERVSGVQTNISDAPLPQSGSGGSPSGFLGERRRPGRHCLQFRLPRPREASGSWVPLELEPGPRNESSGARALCFISKYLHKVASFNFGWLKWYFYPIAWICRCYRVCGRAGILTEACVQLWCKGKAALWIIQNWKPWREHFWDLV